MNMNRLLLIFSVVASSSLTPIYSESCKVGQAFDSSLNRCINSVTTSTTRDNFEKMRGDKDSNYNTYDQNAQNMTGVGYSNNDQDHKNISLGEGARATIQYSATAFTVINSFSKQKGASYCNSSKLLAAAGVIGMAGELGLYLYGKKQINDVQSSMNKTAQSEAYNTQMQAFENLKKEQDVLAQVSRWKRNFYYGMTTLYGLTATLALLEEVPAMQVYVGPPCEGAKAETPTKQDSNIIDRTNQGGGDRRPPGVGGRPDEGTILEDRPMDNTGFIHQSPNIDPAFVAVIDEKYGRGYFENIIKILAKLAMSEAYAQPTADQIAEMSKKAGDQARNGSDALSKGAAETAANTGSGASADSIADGSNSTLREKFKSFTDFMATSWGIAIVSGLQMGLSYSLAADMSDLASKYEKNSAQIDRTMKAFQAAVECKTRDDRGDPKCFCFNTDGSHNSNRAKSQTCLTAWSTQSFDTVGASNYGVDKAAGVTGCINGLTGAFDQECHCKKMKNSKGENSCQKIPQQLVTTLGGAGSAVDAGKTIDEFNKLSEAALGWGQLNTDVLKARGVKTKKALAAVSSKLKPAEQKKMNEIFNMKEEDLLARAKLYAGPEEQKMVNGMFGGQSPNAPMYIDNKALDDARSKVGIPTSAELKMIKGTKKSAAAKAADPFNMLGNGQGEVVAGTEDDGMNKTYKIQDQDIIKDEDVSIWDVVTHRYQQSALPRLFKE